MRRTGAAPSRPRATARHRPREHRSRGQEGWPGRGSTTAVAVLLAACSSAASSTVGETATVPSTAPAPTTTSTTTPPRRPLATTTAGTRSRGDRRGPPPPRTADRAGPHRRGGPVPGLDDVRLRREHEGRGRHAGPQRAALPRRRAGRAPRRLGRRARPTARARSPTSTTPPSAPSTTPTGSRLIASARTGRPSDYLYRGIRTGDRPPPAGYTADDFAVPTLRELIARYPDVPLNIEVKGTGEPAIAAARELISRAHRARAPRRDRDQLVRRSGRRRRASDGAVGRDLTGSGQPRVAGS